MMALVLLRLGGLPLAVGLGPLAPALALPAPPRPAPSEPEATLLPIAAEAASEAALDCAEIALLLGLLPELGLELVDPMLQGQQR